MDESERERYEKNRTPKETLHRSMVELIPDNRLILGPSLSSKRNYDIRDMLLDFNINCIVNLMPIPLGQGQRGRANWYANEYTGELIESLQEYDDDEHTTVQCIRFPMDSEKPVKDTKLFSFVTKLCQMLKSNPTMRMYIHDGDGSHVAASVALTLWYFMQTPEEKKTFDPVQAMKRRGKHQVIPDRKKDFVAQIKRLCALDDKSIHRHLF